MNNICIIGFMGTGKTSVSIELGRMLEQEVLDTDRLIELEAGISINEIFERYGEAYFRDLESAVISSLSQKENCIISCGGGVVLQEENIEGLKKAGVVVLLTAAPPTIYERVRHSSERPLINNHMNIQYIEGLLEKRAAYYRKAAQVTVATDNLSIHKVAEQVLEEVRLFLKG